MAYMESLRLFCRVVELGSITSGGRDVRLTPAVASKRIKELEEHLGVRLFNRTTRKVELTAFGEYILPRLKEVLQSRDELLKAAESYHNPSHKLLRIGFSPLVDMQRLNQVLTPFRQSHPDVTLFFKECFIDDLSERMKLEQIDIQIIPAAEPREGESSCRFYQDNLYYLPALDDPKTQNRLAFEVADLPVTPIILTGGGCGLNDALGDLLKSHNTTLHAYPGQAMSYKVIEDWASLGIGAGILPKAKISSDNKAIYPLFIRKDEPASFSFDWVWRSDQDAPEHITAFLEYIQNTVPMLVQGQAEKTG